MGKPSIFSNQYDRKMKGRKRRNIIIVVAIIFVIAILVGKSYMSKLNKDNGTNQNTNQTNVNAKPQDTKNSNDNKKTSESNKGNDSTTEENNGDIDKKVDVKMSNGQILNLTYQESSGTKQIKEITCSSIPNLYYNISPSGSKAVLLTSSQDMFVVDVSGSIINVTKDTYVTTKGTTIVKSKYLKGKSDFSWHTTPKFINENLIVYISQVPWFQTKKYLWKLDVVGKKHTTVFSVASEDLVFDKMTDKGLSFNIDGATKYIDAEGNIIE